MSSSDAPTALGVDARGPERLAVFFRELLAAAPDLEMTIENIVEDDRHAVVQWSLKGTFDGAPFQGIEPVGRPIALRAAPGASPPPPLTAPAAMAIDPPVSSCAGRRAWTRFDDHEDGADRAFSSRLTSAPAPETSASEQPLRIGFVALTRARR